MGMLVNGLNKYRDFHDTEMSHLEFGKGTTTETKEDTDLETPINNTEKVIDSSTKTSQQLVKAGRLTSVAGTGNTVSEGIWKQDNVELAHSRYTFNGIAHTNEEDINVETRWFYRGASI